MKFMKYFLIFSFLFVVLSSQSQAQSDGGQTGESLCLPAPMTIIFANGVFNDERDAQKALEKIKFLTIKELKKDGFVIGKKLFRCFNEFLEFELQYNRTDGIADIFEAAAQNILLNIGRYWEMRSNEETDESLQELYASSSEWWDKAHYEIDPDLSQFVEVYTEEDQIDIDLYGDGYQFLKAKIGRVVVSHSQGNFYSNIVWTNLPTANKPLYRIIGVATPDSIVGGSGPYISYEDDKIINAARWFTANSRIAEPLPANEPSAEFGSFTRHLFLEDYLRKNSNTRDFIVNNTLNQIPRNVGCYLPPWPWSINDGFNLCICQANADGVITPDEQQDCDCYFNTDSDDPICGD